MAFPGEGARRRRGEVGERQEGGESYSEVGLSRSGAAGSGVGGGAAVRRLWRTAAAAHQRLWAAGSLPWRFSGPRGSKFGGRFESRRGGAGSSAAAGGRQRLCPRRRRAGGDGDDRPGRGASERRGWPVLGFSWDQGRAESRAPRWSSSSGGNGGAAAPFWPRDGSARLGEGRGVEREGGTPLGEANGEGKSSAGGGRSRRASSARARRHGGVLAAQE